MLMIDKQILVAFNTDTLQILKHSFIFTAVGDTVSEDEVVCEIETDKVKQMYSVCDL